MTTDLHELELCLIALGFGVAAVLILRFAG